MAKSYQDHLDVAASKYNIASLKETQGDLEGARRLFLESEQIYAKVFGADHEERRIKRVIAEKDNNTVMTALSQ